MPDWLLSPAQNGTDLSLPEIAGRLVAAFALGCIVAAIYAVTRRRDKGETAGFVATLVLLTILISMVTMVIGNSVARAFSLVGALAIVRFRTVVQDTRDTAFVIFAVVVGMAAGAGYFIVPLIGIPVIAVAAAIFRPGGYGPSRSLNSGTLTVRLDIGRDPHPIVDACFEKHLSKYRLVATGSARQGTALELKYTANLRHTGAAIDLINEMKQMAGVQSVEFRHRQS